jgi:hypothetical protein
MVVEQAKEKAKEKAKDLGKELVKKALKRFGLNFIIELIPFVGGFYPGWTIIVYREMKKELTSPEFLLMLPVAALLDIAGFIIFILGTWFGIDDYGILEIVGGVIIGGWMLIRYSSLGSVGFNNTAKENETDEGSEENEGEVPAQSKKENQGAKKPNAKNEPPTTGAQKETLKKTALPSKKAA